ncbi:hypothetical protein RB195_005953 [Necator americanus]|uniref:Uncharacterized protein n=1 Tax=Necator americanus TaxID=51031 RepID=A0ABR1BQC3_NECAM
MGSDMFKDDIPALGRNTRPPVKSIGLKRHEPRFSCALSSAVEVAVGVEMGPSRKVAMGGASKARYRDAAPHRLERSRVRNRTVLPVVLTLK